MAARESAAVARLVRSRPTPPATTATPAAAKPARRNRLRSYPVIDGVDGSSAEASASRLAASRSIRYANTPATAPAIDGTASAMPFAGRVTAAAAPIAPSTTDAAIPRRGRRQEAAPTAATAIVSTTPIPIRSASLSCSPNVRIAKDFSHSGLASTAAPPTARMGEDPGPKRAASSSAVPSATPAGEHAHRCARDSARCARVGARVRDRRSLAHVFSCAHPASTLRRPVGRVASGDTNVLRTRRGPSGPCSGTPGAG